VNNKKTARVIAFYLPQYHPIPENDMAWGEGFTEWTNVKKAKALFIGHYQPHVPHDTIGYYDLRNPDVLIKQTELAKKYRINGFVFYHYWFNGKRLLNLPVDNYLKQKDGDFPFCLCWANENWTKRWDGLNKEVIIKQDYSFDDDKMHIHFLCKNIFNDQRYISVDGKPLFIVYKPELFPDIKKTVSIWREESKKMGFKDLYICYTENKIHKLNPNKIGFDAAIEFQPQWRSLRFNRKGNLILRLLHRFGLIKYFYGTYGIYDYSKIVKRMIHSSKHKLGYKLFRCVTPMWDNSPRRKSGAAIFHNSTPELYRSWLQHIVDHFQPFSKEENFIFINAWNEWAEGNHLEPCERWGTSYLEATKSVIDNA